MRTVLLRIEEMCQMITGEKLQYIGRCLDMIEIGFGEQHLETEHFSKKMMLVEEHIFHLQCPFRVIDNSNSKVILGHSDIFISSDDTINVDLDKKDSTLFDKKISKILDNIKGEVVKKVDINIYGDLIIHLPSIQIYVFIDASDDCEMWRFFETTKKDKSHLVRTGEKFYLA